MENIVCELTVEYKSTPDYWKVNILGFSPVNFPGDHSEKEIRRSSELIANQMGLNSSMNQKNKEFLEYLLSWPVMSDEEYNYIKEKRKHLNKWR